MTRAEQVAVVIMAKAPRAGLVKTRLCPPLSASEAAELYRCFLLDKVDQVRALKGARAAIAYAPADEKAAIAALAPGFCLFPQEGPSLGARLAHIFDRVLGLGYAGALAIDSDTPTLPGEFLQQAVSCITAPDVDVVLGPTSDGGYYLVGLRTPERDLFERMTWSNPTVFRETVRRAKVKGLRVTCLPCWYDVDVPGDLDRLRDELDTTDNGAPRNTRSFFRR